MGGSQQQFGSGETSLSSTLYRPQSDQTNLDPHDEIMLNFQSRIINDLLKGKLDEDTLRRLNLNPDMNPKNELMPWWYKPIA